MDENNNNQEENNNNNQENNDQSKIDQENNDNYFRSLPIGYLFSPTDQELITNYLRPMVLNEVLPRNRIVWRDIYQAVPDTLIQGHTKIREDGWYFFSKRERKYPKGDRPKRDAGNGYWKATGKHTSIMDENNREIGKKQVLDFRLLEEDKKTDWKMLEYILPNEEDPKQKIRSGRGDDMKLDHSLCKIYVNSRAEGNKKNGAIIIRENDDPISNDDPMITAPVASQTDSTSVPKQEVGQAKPHDSLTVYDKSLNPNSFFIPTRTNHSNGSTSTSINQLFGASTSYATNYEASTSYASNFGDPMWGLSSDIQDYDDQNLYALLSEQMPPSMPSSTSSYGSYRYPFPDRSAEIKAQLQHVIYDMPAVDDLRLPSVPTSHGNDEEFEGIEEYLNIPVDVHENDPKPGEDRTKTD